MKVTTYETLYMKNMVLLWSTLYETCYIMVLLWSTSVEKRIVALPLFIYFLFWAFFSLAFLFFYWDNALLNDDHHTSIYLQLNDYNSILKQSMTPYECLRRCTGICNESRVTSMKELWTMVLPQIQCQLHDHASNMTMMKRAIIMERWKVAWQYISEWLWKCHNG